MYKILTRSVEIIQRSKKSEHDPNVDMQLWYFNGGFIVNKRSGFVLDVVVGAKCQTGELFSEYYFVFSNSTIKHDEPSRGQEWEYNYKDNSFYLKFNRNFVLDVSGPD
ncbi:unnamed protein product [Rhizophagus irregularis]|nr:unnamed protein product [Rhizophagus irregularis]